MSNQIKKLSKTLGGRTALVLLAVEILKPIFLKVCEEIADLLEVDADEIAGELIKHPRIDGAASDEAFDRLSDDLPS
jgi:hypothetical protein